MKSRRETDLAGAAAAMRPEPLLVPARPVPGWVDEWWIAPYSRTKAGVSLYRTTDGKAEDETHAVIKRGGWWFSQSVGEAYRTDWEVGGGHFKSVVVRGHPGVQFKTRVGDSDFEACVLNWNEPATGGGGVRRYAIASPLETCESAQLEFANGLVEYDGR